jgi:hypothetical protein
VVLVWALAVSAGAGEVEPKAAEIFALMDNHLAALQSLVIEGEITDETVFGDRHKLQFGGTATLSVQAPDRMFAAIDSETQHRRFYLNKGAFAMFDRDLNIYVTTSLPVLLPAAAVHLGQTYGLDLPVAELLMRSTRRKLIEDSEKVVYIGEARVRGQACRHIAGTMGAADWQLWISVEKEPRPCKYIITDRSIPLAPQFTIVFDSWKSNVRIPAERFAFRPPEGAEQIEILPVQQAEGGEK